VGLSNQTEKKAGTNKARRFLKPPQKPRLCEMRLQVLQKKKKKKKRPAEPAERSWGGVAIEESIGGRQMSYVSMAPERDERRRTLDRGEFVREEDQGMNRPGGKAGSKLRRPRGSESINRPSWRKKTEVARKLLRAHASAR